MFIAHLPAGYVSAVAAQRCGLRARGLMAACLVGSLLPDADLLWCYLVDGGRVHHHLYWPHWPVVWLALLLLTLGACGFRGLRPWALPPVFLAGSALTHIALDALVGDVPLFAPWSMEFYALATVEARYSPWWLNFFLHWSMLVELTLCATAFTLFIRRR